MAVSYEGIRLIPADRILPRPNILRDIHRADVGIRLHAGVSGRVLDVEVRGGVHGRRVERGPQQQQRDGTKEAVEYELRGTRASNAGKWLCTFHNVKQTLCPPALTRLGGLGSEGSGNGSLVSWSQRYWCVAKGVWRGVGGDGEVEKPKGSRMTLGAKRRRGGVMDRE